jgi:hypothetical protein
VAFLSINAPWDSLQPAQLFLKVYKVDYPVGRDTSGAIGYAYAIEATPTSLFIDKKGILVAREERGMNLAEFTEKIEALLK